MKAFQLAYWVEVAETHILPTTCVRSAAQLRAGGKEEGPTLVNRT